MLVITQKKSLVQQKTSWKRKHFQSKGARTPHLAVSCRRPGILATFSSTLFGHFLPGSHAKNLWFTKPSATVSSSDIDQKLHMVRSCWNLERKPVVLGVLPLWYLEKWNSGCGGSSFETPPRWSNSNLLPPISAGYLLSTLGEIARRLQRSYL